MSVWTIKERNNLVRKNTATRGAQLGLFAGGATPSNVGVVDRINVNNRGNATDFGDLVRGNQCGCGFGSSTRGIQYAGEDQVNYLNNIDYINWASQGNFSDFGDSTQPGGFRAGHSNNIRGVSFGTYTPVIANPYVSNTIDFITIGSLGNATDFGDLTAVRMGPKGAGSTTRAYAMAGSGNNSFTDYGTHCDTVLIATTGNATDYGDMATGTNEGAAFSSNVRGVHAGGRIDGAYTNVIQLIALATTGTGSDFGDLSAATRRTDGLDNSIRGIVAGGLAPGNTNVIESVEIATTGDATDFGDLTSARHHPVGIDSSHGGIDFDEIQRPQVTGLPSKDTPPRSPGRTIGIFGGGYFGASTGTYRSNCEIIQVETLGRSSNFGELTAAVTNSFTMVGNRTRGVRATGYTGGGSPDTTNVMDYTEFASRGNFADFGDATAAAYGSNGGPGGNDVRSFRMGAYNSGGNLTTVDYWAPATLGNAADFGDLSVGGTEAAGMASTTRVIRYGSYDVNTIDYHAIASLGDFSDFGDAVAAVGAGEAVSSPVRGVRVGGQGASNTMEYITMASTGDATDFGDLTAGRAKFGAACSHTRGVMMGGSLSSGFSDTIDYITIASAGDAADFGDMSATRTEFAGMGNGHGGLA